MKSDCTLLLTLAKTNEEEFARRSQAKFLSMMGGMVSSFSKEEKGWKFVGKLGFFFHVLLYI